MKMQAWREVPSTDKDIFTGAIGSCPADAGKNLPITTSHRIDRAEHIFRMG